MADDLRTLLADIAQGRVRSFYLFHGSDDFLPGEAAREVAHALVPEAQRGFNLERPKTDGLGIEEIVSALNTYPFMPGRKVVWVERSDLSPAKTYAVTPLKRALRGFSAERPKASVRTLGRVLKLLGIEGARLSGEASRVAEHVAEEAGLDASGAEMEVLHELIEAYRANVPDDVGGDDAEALVEAAKKGWPEKNTLVMTLPRFNGATRAGKALIAAGAVVKLDPTASDDGKKARPEDVLEEAARLAGVKLTRAALGVLAERIDVGNPRLVQSELEKLATYAGGASVDDAAVRDLVAASRADPFWELSSALGEQKGRESLHRLQELVAQKTPTQLIAAGVLNEVRRLHRARLAIEGPLSRVYQRGMAYGPFKDNVVTRLEDGGASIQDSENAPNPFALYKLFQRAEKLATVETRAAVQRALALDMAMKGSRVEHVMLLETFIIEFCLKKPGARSA